MHCYLEVAETNSVVVEIPKPFLAGKQIGNECLNVNKRLTNLAGSVVESAFFGVFLQKLQDCNTYGGLSNKQAGESLKLSLLDLDSCHPC